MLLLPNSISSQGFWLVLLGAIFWGTTGTAQTFAPDSANPLTVGAIRIAIGGSVLLIAALWRGRFKLKKKMSIGAVILASCGMAFYQPFFFTAVGMTGVAIGTIVTIGSAPIFAGLLALLVLKERPALHWYWATGLAISGCILLIAPGGDDRVNILGIILALCAGLSFSCYILASKKLLAENPADIVLAVVFTVGAIFLAPLLFIYKPTWLLEPSGILAALHLGLIATALAYALFTSGLALLPVATAVTITLAEPLTAALLGIFLVGERLSALSLTGALLVLFALIIISRKSK